MKYKILKTLEEFAEYETVWNDFYKKLENVTPFQSFAWNFHWYKQRYGNHRLQIIVIYKESPAKPSLIAPTMVDGAGALRFIADGHSDHSAFLMDFGTKRHVHYEILKTLKKAIEENDAINALELKNIDQNDHAAALFVSLLDFKRIMYQSNAFSYIDLTPKQNFLECFDYMTSKQRSELKRVYKKNGSMRSRIVEKSDGMPFPKESIETLRDEMIAAGARDANFMNEKLLGVTEALYEAGLLEVHLLEDEKGEAVSANLLLHYGKACTKLFWIDLYRDLPFINLSSYLHYIKRMCEEAKEPFRIDFGRGLYEYKTKNFLPVIEMQYTLYYAKSESGFTKYLLKTNTLMAIKNFYKRHKSTINKVLGR